MDEANTSRDVDGTPNLKRKEDHSKEILTEIKRNIRRRCIQQSRKYTFKDLYMVRQLQSYRELPTNLLCNPDNLIAVGQGLCINMQHGLESQFQARLKQIKLAKNSVGYKNYRELIPKTERSANLPRTPTAHEMERHSKRTFDIIVSKWKKRLHEWDNIVSHAEIPFHLLTPRLLHQRQVMSSQRSRSSQPRYLWSPKNRARSPWRQKVSRGDGDDHDDEKAVYLSEIQNMSTRDQLHRNEAPQRQSDREAFDDEENDDDDDDMHCKLRLEFEEDDERDDDKKSTLRDEYEEQTRRQMIEATGWMKSRGDDDGNVISTNEAVKCLQDCILSVTAGNAPSSGNEYGELIVQKFSEKLNQFTQK